MRILFLQLPCLDNETPGVRENPATAGFYLSHSLGRTGKASVREVRFLSPEEEALDDRGLTELIGEWQPDLVCATLYLWNVERTLHLLRRARKGMPSVRFVVGGPEVAPDLATPGRGWRRQRPSWGITSSKKKKLPGLPFVFLRSQSRPLIGFISGDCREKDARTIEKPFRQRHICFHYKQESCKIKHQRDRQKNNHDDDWL